MKISLIYEYLVEPGGLERTIANHAKFLEKEGHEVTVLTCHKSKVTEKLLFDGLKINEVSLIKTPFVWINILLCLAGLNTLGRVKSDVLISYSFPSNILIRNKKSCKVVYLSHFPHFLYLNKK